VAKTLAKVRPEVAAVIAQTNRADPAAMTGYDAIIVGAGASGGLAADLLCETGLKTLVLDAGHRTGFWRAPARRATFAMLSAMATPQAVKVIPRKLLWKAERMVRKAGAAYQPVQSRCYAWPSAPEDFVDDRTHPYETAEGVQFDWIRVHGVGGRMTVPLHGRQYLRHTATDFRPTDGLSPAWPFRPEELDPFYDLVEKRLELAGTEEDLPTAPASRLSRVLKTAPWERELIDKISSAYPGYRAVLGRFAPPVPALASAAATGRLSCRTGAVARHLETDGKGRVTGVVYHDTLTGKLQTVRAPLVFLCASTLESTRLLLTTRAERGGAGSRTDDPLGRYLMDHATMRADGTGPAIDWGDEKQEQGRCVYMPRFDLRSGDGSTRGFAMRVFQYEAAGGQSYFTAAADGEMLPRADNQVRLSSRKNALGFPMLHISCTHGPAELELEKKMRKATDEILELCKVTPDASNTFQLHTPGSNIHECGTARMGNDPATSAVGRYNESWEFPGVRVTDGACFPSQGIQNPTLTILAVTARACQQAVGVR
jgi:choline dehydrogenase-like flavoprotein